MTEIAGCEVVSVFFSIKSESFLTAHHELGLCQIHEYRIKTGAAFLKHLRLSYFSTSSTGRISLQTVGDLFLRVCVCVCVCVHNFVCYQL